MLVILRKIHGLGTTSPSQFRTGSFAEEKAVGSDYGTYSFPYFVSCRHDSRNMALLLNETASKLKSTTGTLHAQLKVCSHAGAKEPFDHIYLIVSVFTCRMSLGTFLETAILCGGSGMPGLRFGYSIRS